MATYSISRLSALAFLSLAACASPSPSPTLDAGMQDAAVSAPIVAEIDAGHRLASANFAYPQAPNGTPVGYIPITANTLGAATWGPTPLADGGLTYPIDGGGISNGTVNASALSPGAAGQVLWTPNGAAAPLWAATGQRSAVTADSADQTGSADSSTAIHNCLVNAAAANQCCWLPPGTFKVANPITVPSFGCLVGSPSTVIHSTITPGGSNANSVFFAGPTYSGQTDNLAANNTPGASTLSLSTNTGLSVGTIIVTYAGPTSPLSLRTQQYTITAISGIGPYTVTADRPVLDSYLTSNSAEVAVVTSRPQFIRIIGNGMKISGTGWRYSELVTCYRCAISDVVADESLGTLQNDYAFSFDIAGLENVYDRVRVNAAVPQGGIVFESNERGVAHECYAQGMSTAGFLDQDSFSTRFLGDQASSTPSCVEIGSDASNLGTKGDQVIGGAFTTCTYGVNVFQGSSDTTIDGITASYNTGAGVYASASGAASTRTTISNSFLTSNVTGLLVDPTVTGTIGTGLDLSNNTGSVNGTALNAGTTTDVTLSGIVAKGLGSYGFISGGTLNMSGFEVQTSVASNFLVSNINTTGPAPSIFRLVNGHFQLDGNSDAAILLSTPSAGTATAYLSHVKVDGAGSSTSGVAANTSTAAHLGAGMDLTGASTPINIAGSGTVDYRNYLGSSLVFEQGGTSADFASFGTTPGSNGSVRCTTGTDCVDSPGALQLGGASATSVTEGNSSNTVSVNADWAPGTGATYGFFAKRNGVFYGSIQGLVGAESTDSALYIGPGLTPSGTNYTYTSDGSTFGEFNAPNSMLWSLGGSAYLGMNTSAVFPNSAGLIGAGLSTNPFGSSFLGASTTSGLGYTEFAAASGTHNTQDALSVCWNDSEHMTTYSAKNFNVYPLGGGSLTTAHGLSYTCTITGRVVTAGTGTGCTFWATGAHGTPDTTFACTVRATGQLHGGVWSAYAAPYYIVCDVTGSTNPATGTGPTNPVFTFSATTTTSPNEVTIQWAPFNDACGTSAPVIDAQSRCCVEDN